MVTYALNINEFSTNDFALIAIHTVLSEYQLAYLLNKHLHIKFSKASYNLDFTQKKIKLLILYMNIQIQN
ncbi:IPExxxVDY family protein [Tenacibaculum ovolyticum]|uniref:IPExxxVDY family protein n=1 Tax=Tenacibaculum ovolyticum TaxID=104270 RepID=UPI003A5C451C